MKKLNKNIKLYKNIDQIHRPSSLNDIIYESIRKAILSGKLVSGEIYNELELARKFGISRTPVREALLRLSSENLIVLHPRKGISVNYFTKGDIEDLFELRQIIEEKALTKIMGNLSENQIQSIKGILADQENCLEKYDENRFLEFDRKFHLFFIETSGNRFMVQTYNNIRDSITIPARKALKREGRAKEVLYEHRAMFEALCQENSEKVKETLKIHLNKSKLASLESNTEQKDVMQN